MTWLRPTHALVRGISDAFFDALVRERGTQPPDVHRARVQHAAYVGALRELGLTVTALPPRHDLPDACFVEDQLVVHRGVSVICRSGAVGRRGEVDGVAEAFADVAVHRVRGPATVDGGDVLALGDRVYVGRSTRTNDAGIASLRRWFRRVGVDVVAVPVPAHELHLKCVCSPLSEDTVLLAEGTVDPRLFAGATIVPVPASESYAANAVAVGRRVLLSSGHPVTASRVRAAGWEPIALDTSEIRKADGALTCLSVRYREEDRRARQPSPS